ncbi:hypothetical protein B1C78_00580 [Thioalkalivibrio denitrificans]|uniref:Uncharacterized protein n=1 Tax=Thioalkalivibrio denitrificans TaxID=108003 RepID=A0A1V3NVM4_9GAMM|nr:hypothetical protein [Thioalkalivibrio denitrificans]OOG28862.1 hypothetical protein B1C78_00580 [Thioalkalivibrio denitrificans]
MKTSTVPAIEIRSDAVWVFQGATLAQALADWSRTQIAGNPDQEPRIREIVEGVERFLHSDQARNHKMLLEKCADR